MENQLRTSLLGRPGVTGASRFAAIVGPALFSASPKQRILIVTAVSFRCHRADAHGSTQFAPNGPGVSVSLAGRGNGLSVVSVCGCVRPRNQLFIE